MFKPLSWIVALSVVAAPLLAISAEPVLARPHRVHVGSPHRGRAPVVIRGVRRGRIWHRDRRFDRPVVIVAPRVRPVIARPRYVRDRCGSVIYGSPIASPVLVDPYTGLACR